MLRNKKELIENFEYLFNQVTGAGEETYTEHGLKHVIEAVRDVIHACPEKIADAVLEERWREEIKNA